MGVDKTDMELIYELDNNCRTSLNSIAKKLRISRNVALYRLNKLKELGIVKGTFTEINNVALGYYSFRVFIKLGNFSKEQETGLMNFILSQRNLIWLSKVLGKWDLDLVYITKNIFEFDDFRKKLFLSYNQILEDTHISLLTQIFHYPKDYLISQKRDKITKKVLDHKIKTEIDEIDEKILYLLSHDATQNIIDIANKIDISINTLKKRIKNLEENRIILGYRLLLDTNKLGYNYYKLHLNLRNYNSFELTKLQTFLESKNYMIYIDHYISGEDFEIELHLKEEKEYLSFIDELNEKFGKIIKEHFLLKFYQEFIFRYLPENNIIS